MTISTFLGAELVKRYRDTLGYPTLLTFYITYTLASNVLASRISEFNMVVPLMLTGGTITFPFVGQIIDMINEIYGRKATYNAIYLTFLANVMVSAFIYMLSTVPPAPWLAGLDEAWKYFMLQTPRVVVASYVAFLTSDLLDATVFAEIKKKFYRREPSTGSMLKAATLRSLTSDVVGMIVDSLVFFPLAFAFTVPPDVLWSLIWYGFYAKILLTMLDTPWFVAFRLLTRSVKREL